MHYLRAKSQTIVKGCSTQETVVFNLAAGIVHFTETLEAALAARLTAESITQQYTKQLSRQLRTWVSTLCVTPHISVNLM